MGRTGQRAYPMPMLGGLVHSTRLVRARADAVRATAAITHSAVLVPAAGGAVALAAAPTLREGWSDISSWVDSKVTDGRKRLLLPSSPGDLAGLVPTSQLPSLLSPGAARL
jgi:hypothetical protein